MKRCVFVVGPEGSGTYMLAEACVSAGCHYNSEYEQPIDTLPLYDMPNLIVMRRSIPQAGKIPDLNKMVDALKEYYQVHVLFIVRDFYATMKSVQNRTASTHDPDTHYQYQITAIEEIGRMISHDILWTLDFTYVTYEAFTTQPGFRKWLFNERLSLAYLDDYEAENRNGKYYE